MHPPIALTIAAHDPLGGAGLAADLTTFAALGVHGVAAITAVTAQHLRSVEAVAPTQVELVDAQLDGIIADLPPAAMKTGLLGSPAIVRSVAARVSAGTLPAPVVDPVLVDGRGRRFVDAEIERAYREHLFPVARVITPNLAEAALLVGRPLSSVDDVISAADSLRALGAPFVVVTGGALVGEEARDVVIMRDGTIEKLTGPRIDTGNVRGSGCTHAAAMAAALARHDEPLDAIRAAKRFVADRLASAAEWSYDFGGPISHRFER